MSKNNKFGFKNAVALLLAWCMIVQSVLTNGSFSAWGAADTGDPIHFERAELYRKDGTIIENGAKEIDMSQPVKLRYIFSVNYHEGDSSTLDFNLPEQLRIDTPLNFPISSEEKDDFARVSVKTNGTVTFRLSNMTDKIEVDEVWFEIEAFWDLDDVKDSNTVQLKFHIGNAETENLEVTLVPPANLKALMGVEKNGAFFKEENVIEWTVKIKPETKPAGYPVRNVVFSDVIEADQEFIDGSASCVLLSESGEADSRTFSRAAFGFGADSNMGPGRIPEATGSNSDRSEPDFPTATVSTASSSRRARTRTTTGTAGAYGSSPSNATSSEAEYQKDKQQDKTDQLPSFMAVEEQFDDGFHYNENTRTLFYTFKSAIEDGSIYEIKYRTKFSSEHMDYAKIKKGDGIDIYPLNNTANVVYPANAIGDPGDPGDPNYKVVTDTAGVEYPIEYILKEGTILESSGLVRWNVSVNPAGMKVENAVIADTFNPNGKKFLKLDTDSVSYNGNKLTRCTNARTETRNGRSITVCADNSPDHFYYDETNRIITYEPGTISDSGSFTYDTYIDADEYAAAGSPEISNQIALGGNGGWYGKGAAVIHPTTGWIIKEGNGYDSHTHYVTWKVTVNGNSQPLKAAVFTDRLSTDASEDYAQKYVDGTFKIDGAEVDSLSVVTGTDENKKSIETLEYAFGDIDKPHTVEFQTEVLNPKYFNQNSSGRLSIKNSAALKASYHNQEITETAAGGQEIISTVLSKTAADYNYAKRLMTWLVGINTNKTPIESGVFTDVLDDTLQYAYTDHEGNTVPITDVNDISKAVIWVDESGQELKTEEQPAGVTIEGSKTNDAVNGLTIRFGSSWSDGSKYPCYFKLTTTFREGQYEKLFGNNNVEVILTNEASLEGVDLAPVFVTADQKITNTLLGKTAIYEEGGEEITWRVVINEHAQPIPVEPGAALNTIHLLDKLDAGLILDVDSVKLYDVDLSLPEDGVIDWGEILKTADTVKSTFGKFTANGSENSGTASGNICYDTESNIFRYFLAPNDASFHIADIQNNSILAGKTYVLEFKTDIKPESSNVGKISNNIQMVGAAADQTSSGDADGIHYNTGQGGGSGRKGSIKIIKRDRYSGDVLNGAKFTLADNSAAHEALNLQPSRTETNSEGEAIFSMLYYNIPYMLEETEPANNAYMSPEPEDISIPEGTSGVTVDKNGITLLKNGLKSKQGVLTVNVTNRPKLGWIELRKQSTYENRDVFLNGAKIEVIDIRTNKRAAMWVADDKGGKKPVDAVKNTEARDGEDGWVTFEGLRCGEYYMQETGAPEGYAKTSDRIYFKIETDRYSEHGLRSDGENAKGVYYDVDSDGKLGSPKTDQSAAGILKNSPVGKITVKKTQYGDGTILIPGGVFSIFTDVNAAKAANGSDASGQLGSITTDSTGKGTFSNLTEGIYYIKEVTAPKHYAVMGDGIIEVILAAEWDSSSNTEVMKLYWYPDGKSSDKNPELAADNTITVENLPRGTFVLTKKTVIMKSQFLALR